jgi:hypothetical protein
MPDECGRRLNRMRAAVEVGRGGTALWTRHDRTTVRPSIAHPTVEPGYHPDPRALSQSDDRARRQRNGETRPVVRDRSVKTSPTEFDSL